MSSSDRGTTGENETAGELSAILLAAGASTRMGRTKQLLPFRGKPILQHVIDLASSMDPLEILVVLGHTAPEIEADLRLPAGARVVFNPEYPSGQASSLRAGLEAASPRSRAALLLVGDQPEIEPETVRAVVRRYRETAGRVVRTEYEAGTPGHPVILDRTVWEAACSLEGDTGARALLSLHPEWLIRVPIPGRPPVEVDTPADYQRLLALAEAGAGTWDRREDPG